MTPRASTPCVTGAGHAGLHPWRQARLNFRSTNRREICLMKVKSSIKAGADYLCTKLGDVVTAIQQVAVLAPTLVIQPNGSCW